MTEKKHPTYSKEDQQAALRLAATIGVRAACRELGISRSTMQAWQTKNPELWSDLRKGNQDRFQANFADRLEELAADYTEVEQAAIDRAATLIKSADAKETAALIKAMGSSRAGAAVNARTARGEPDSTSAVNINFPQLEAAMARLLEGAQPLPALPVVNEAEQDA